jgi:hypothetical protein
MKNKIISAIVILFVLTSSAEFSPAQSQIKYKKPESRNVWGLGFSYAENGFGPSVSLYAPIGRSTDLSFGLMVSGVTDTREIQRYDVFGNSINYGKINRVFMIPLSIGIKTELFKDNIEGDFVPVFNAGISPTLILTDPYDQSFFNALNSMTTHFGFGGYTGFGVNFKESKSLSMSVNLNYYYLPIIGDGVQSVDYSTINNVGGLQLVFGVIFMK